MFLRDFRYDVCFESAYLNGSELVDELNGCGLGFFCSHLT